MNDVPLNACHLPDEYVDAVVSFQAETYEASNQASVGRGAINRSFAPLHWLRSVSDQAITKDSQVKNELKLSSCDLPDEYVDAAVLSFDDSDDISEGTLPSAADLLGSISSPLSCLRHHCDESASEDCHDTSDVVLSDYDLPDEYVPTEISISQREPVEHDTHHAQQQIPQSQSLDHVDEERIHRLVSYEPHVGLSRRRRKYYY